MSHQAPGPSATSAASASPHRWQDACTQTAISTARQETLHRFPPIHPHFRAPVESTPKTARAPDFSSDHQSNDDAPPTAATPQVVPEHPAPATASLRPARPRSTHPPLPPDHPLPGTPDTQAGSHTIDEPWHPTSPKQRLSLTTIRSRLRLRRSRHHRPHFGRTIARCRTPRRPFQCSIQIRHLNHKKTSQHLLRLRIRPIVQRPLAIPNPHRRRRLRRLQTRPAHHDARLRNRTRIRRPRAPIRRRLVRIISFGKIRRRLCEDKHVFHKIF